MLEGDMNVALGKLIKAYECYNEATILAEEEGESDDTQAILCIKQQSCVHAQGKNNEALDNLNPLLAKSKLSPSVLGLLKRSLGNVYRSAANFHLGEKYLFEAVEIAKSLGDNIHLNEWRGELGRVYRSSGLHRKALELQRNAYEAALARGDVARLAFACGYIGFTNYSLSQPNCDEAIKYIGSRLLLSKNKLGDNEGVRWCVNNIGKVYLTIRNVQPAIACFTQSLELVRGTGNLLGVGTAFGNLGSALREAGKYDEAVMCHKEYLENASQRLDPGGEAIMLYELAVDHVLKTDFVKAREFALNAIVKLQNIHVSLTQEDSQLKIGNFEKNQVKAFNILQYILSELGEHDAALLISELGRARTLANLMEDKTKTPSELTSGVSKVVKDNACIDVSLVNTLCNHIKDIVRRLHSTLVVYSLVDCGIGRQEQWVFIWVIPLQSRKLIFSKKLIEIKGVTDFQLDEEYFGGLRRDIGVPQQDTFIVSTMKDRRDIKLSKAKSQVKAINSEHTSIGLGVNAMSSADILCETPRGEQLELLYGILIEPIIDCLQSDCGSDPQRLILVPHRIIFSVPFAALRKNNLYLVEQFVLSQVPSLSVLDQLIKLATHYTRTCAAFVVGDPVMPHNEICQLPGSAVEARIVHQIMGGKLLLNEQVTKKAVMESMPSHSIVHLATHATIADSIAEHLQGTVNDIEGDYSTKGAIVLSKSSPTCSGILTSTEVQDLRLSCELITLSCCRTACGKITGDGVLGISRAVLLAGACCFITTLWAIEDQSTSKLMEVFYTNYEECYDAPRAMRSAMLALLAEKHKIAHWAAFCVTGVSPGML